MPQGPPPEYVARYRSFIRNFPDYNIRPTQHAYQRMAEHAATSTHIRRVLRRGVLRHVERDIGTGLDRYRVSGHDADGRALEVVFNLDDTGNGRVVVITVIAPGR